MRNYPIARVGGEGYTGLYTFVKTHQTVHFQWERLIVCKLYLNEVDLKIRVGHFIEMKTRLEVTGGCR